MSIGECIPVRFFLNLLELTPTYHSVHHKFSVKYYLNFVILDELDRKYFQQREIVLWRKKSKIKNNSMSSITTIGSKDNNSQSNPNSPQLSRTLVPPTLSPSLSHSHSESQPPSHSQSPDDYYLRMDPKQLSQLIKESASSSVASLKDSSSSTSSISHEAKEVKDNLTGSNENDNNENAVPVSTTLNDFKENTGS